MTMMGSADQVELCGGVADNSSRPCTWPHLRAQRPRVLPGSLEQLYVGYTCTVGDREARGSY